MIWAGSQLAQWLECPTSFRYAPNHEMMMTSIFPTRKCLLYFKANGTINWNLVVLNSFGLVMMWWGKTQQKNLRMEWCHSLWGTNEAIHNWNGDHPHLKIQIQKPVPAKKFSSVLLQTRWNWKKYFLSEKTWSNKKLDLKSFSKSLSILGGG